MRYISKKPYVPLGSRKFRGEVMNALSSLNTVCHEANCPNVEECFKNKTATFMILGKFCTRRCKFCGVGKGMPEEVDKLEPSKIADVVNKLGLSHAVITSVTRDDLEDGGAYHFAEVIRKITEKTNASVEVLTPDFLGKDGAIETVIAANPKVMAHNVEMVASLYKDIRPRANYQYSLNFLKKVKEKDRSMLTKSSIMLGLGESDDEITKTIKDIKDQGTDFLTIGQYLKSSKNNIGVKKYYSGEEFEYFKNYALSLGFKAVFSSPLTRSSHNAALML